MYLDPSYTYFSKFENWGDSQVLDDCISMMYEYIYQRDLVEPFQVEEMKERIDGIIPDTGDFSTPLTSFAVDACCAFYDAIDYLSDKDVEKIVNVSVYCRDTVDMFIQLKDDLNSTDPNLEYKIAFSSFMVYELDRQRKLLKELRKITVMNDKIIAQLKESVNKKGIVELALLTI